MSDAPVILDVPAEYDYEPKKPYRIATLPAREQERACGGIKNACAIPGKRVIVISDAMKGIVRELLLRHEKAHLNGWRH
jgi:hypothetical protein